MTCGFGRGHDQRTPVMMTVRARVAAIVGAVVIGGVSAVAADVTFLSTWKSPEAKPIDFAGRLVTALVIVDDENLRMSAEEALAREITARGPRGTPAYRVVPREELADKDRAKAWFEKAGVEGAVILRLVGADTQKVYSSVVWASGYYPNVWDYYGYGWSTAAPIGRGRNQTTITVETLLYDLKSANLIWAAVTSTTDPKDASSYMKELSREVVKNLEKHGLVRKGTRR